MIVPMVMMFMIVPVLVLLVLLVLVLRKVRADSANNRSCNSSQHAPANLVGQEPTASATNQCCAQSTLAILTWSVKASALWLSRRASSAGVAIGRLLRTVGRLGAVCGLLTVRGLLVWAGVAIVLLWRIGVWSTVWLLRGCAVARLRRGGSVIWLWWVASLISLGTVIRLGGVILV